MWRCSNAWKFPCLAKMLIRISIPSSRWVRPLSAIPCQWVTSIIAATYLGFNDSFPPFYLSKTKLIVSSQSALFHHNAIAISNATWCSFLPLEPEWSLSLWTALSSGSKINSQELRTLSLLAHIYQKAHGTCRSHHFPPQIKLNYYIYHSSLAEIMLLSSKNSARELVLLSRHKEALQSKELLIVSQRSLCLQLHYLAKISWSCNCWVEFFW